MNPIFLKIGSFELHYYGLMYALAFIIGIYIAKKMARERNFDEKIIDDYAFIAIISGLIGGRLYYVLFNLDYYLNNLSEIPAVWHGGMAIHGGIIGGIIGTLIYGKIKKINPLVLGDYAAAPFILGQAIGRFGNLMNGEIHGVPTFTPLSIIFNLKPKFAEWYTYYQSLPLFEKAKFPDLVPWGIVFPLSSPAGTEFPNLALHPAMIYELILNFIGFCVIWFILRKKENKATGHLWWSYIIIYSINRIIVSFFRAEDLMIWGLRAPHLVSIIMIIIALLFLKLGEKNKL
ncbi:prolipoprotein diacylglyceryl transferase [Fusobacterium russii]|uniref:prolipoprotein diacylglyceryl transferase n=1 Tax=Fusobacterium russii TaxID=854 RepID=UPI0003A2A6AE|nr:prolipoprotein diacylglyceryl transferase [Fusobacterium russii]